MSLITINPDVKLLVKELKRIAASLERYLILEYGHRQEPVDSKELKGEPADVSYSTDELTMQRELDVARGKLKDILDIDDTQDVLE